MPSFGPINIFLSIFYVVMIGALMAGSWRRRNATDEKSRIEYLFVAVGLFVLLVIGSLAVVILPGVLGHSKSVPLSFVGDKMIEPGTRIVILFPHVPFTNVGS